MFVSVFIFRGQMHIWGFSCPVTKKCFQLSGLVNLKVSYSCWSVFWREEIYVIFGILHIVHEFNFTASTLVNYNATLLQKVIFVRVVISCFLSLLIKISLTKFILLQLCTLLLTIMYFIVSNNSYQLSCMHIMFEQKFLLCRKWKTVVLNYVNF